jgi:hypothetical protein
LPQAPSTDEEYQRIAAEAGKEHRASIALILSISGCLVGTTCIPVFGLATLGKLLGLMLSSAGILTALAGLGGKVTGGARETPARSLLFALIIGIVGLIVQIAILVAVANWIRSPERLR